MKICVLIKQVPDTESQIDVAADGKSFSENGVKWILNPFDEYAVEEALKLREKIPQSEVVVVTLGEARSIDAVRAALAMGADRGVLIDSGKDFLDLGTSAKILSHVILDEKFDIVFAGKQACDDDLSAMPQFVAEFCKMNFAGPAEKFDLAPSGSGCLIEKSAGAGEREVIEVDFPCIISCEKGLNVPRYPSLPNIMKSKTKPVARFAAAELAAVSCNKISLCGWKKSTERAAGKKLVLEADAAAQEIVRFLKNEAKVI